MSQVLDAVSTISGSAVDAQRVAVQIRMTPMVQRVAARHLGERQVVSASEDDAEYIKDLERAIDSAHKMLDALEKDKGKIDEDAYKSFRKGVEENIARYTKKIRDLQGKSASSRMDKPAKCIVARFKAAEDRDKAETILESATIYDGNGCQQISIVQHISSPWRPGEGANFSYVFKTHANHFGAGVSTETTIDSPKTAEWLADAFRRTAEVMHKNGSVYSRDDYDPDIHYQDGHKIEGVSYARSRVNFRG